MITDMLVTLTFLYVQLLIALCFLVPIVGLCLLLGITVVPQICMVTAVIVLTCFVAMKASKI